MQQTHMPNDGESLLAAAFALIPLSHNYGRSIGEEQGSLQGPLGVGFFQKEIGLLSP